MRLTGSWPWLGSAMLVASSLACGGHSTKDGNSGASTMGGGGSSSASGGSPGPAGGASSGGDAESGGSAGSSGSAGASGSAGSGDAVIVPTAGCAKDPGQAPGEWQQYFVPLDGETLGAPQTTNVEREIFVRLPPDYDSTKPYRVVYIGVGCGGSNAASTAYPLWDVAQGGDPNAIYVALSVPDPPLDNGCYDVRSGVNSIEWESFDHDHAFVSERFCLDNSRVHTAAYSSDGSIADMYACYFGGVPDPPRRFLPNVALRGAMQVASCGVLTNEYPACNGPVARLFIQDQDDQATHTLACAQADRDRALLQNGCGGDPNGPTEPWGADFFKEGSCLKYTACPSEYPVIFCTTVGRGHSAQTDNAIPGFVRFIAELEAGAP